MLRLRNSILGDVVGKIQNDHINWLLLTHFPKIYYKTKDNCQTVRNY